MTLTQRLTAIKNNLTSILGAVNTQLVNKGASAVTELEDVATAIGTIPTGITPTGTVSITQNGTVDVTQYASANVAVPPYAEVETLSQTLVNEATSISFANPKNKVPKAIVLTNSNDGQTMKLGEVREVNMFHHLGSGYRNNRVNGQNGYAPYVLNSYETVSWGNVRWSESTITISRAGSNTFFLSDGTTYYLAVYYWGD